MSAPSLPGGTEPAGPGGSTALYDSRELTADARAAFRDRFARQVDPEGTLSEAERERRAECARKAYFAALAAKSAKARRLRRVKSG